MMFYIRRLEQTQDNLKSGRTKIVNVHNHNENENEIDVDDADFEIGVTYE